MIRREWDEDARLVRTWVDGAEQTPREFNAAEHAAADALATATARESRLATLLDRAETAQQNNRDSLSTLAGISGATTFNNTQRDNALRYLAERVEALTRQNNALMQLTLRLAGRVAALDAPD